MLRKILCFGLILFCIFALINIVHAVDINSIENPRVSNDDTIDDTTYNANLDTTDLDNTIPTSDETLSDYEQVATTSTDYDVSSDLSISNMINIILIVVGVVLVLLGIAIIIKLK